MKIRFFFFVFVAIFSIHANAQVFLPKLGTTATRPSFARRGMLQYNTDSAAFEFFNGVTWQKIGAGSGGGAGNLEQVLAAGNTSSLNMRLAGATTIVGKSKINLFEGDGSGNIDLYSGSYDEMGIQLLGVDAYIYARTGYNVGPNGLYRVKSPDGTKAGQMYQLNSGAFGFRSNGSWDGRLNFHGLTNHREYRYPDSSGTLALQEWVSTQALPLTYSARAGRDTGLHLRTDGTGVLKDWKFNQGTNITIERSGDSTGNEYTFHSVFPVRVNGALIGNANEINIVQTGATGSMSGGRANVNISAGGGGSSGPLATGTVTNQSSIVFDLSSYTGKKEIKIKLFGITTATNDNKLHLTSSADGSDYSGTYVKGGSFTSTVEVLTNMGTSDQRMNGEIVIVEREAAGKWPEFYFDFRKWSSGNIYVRSSEAATKGTDQATTHVRLTTEAGTVSFRYEIWGE